MINENYIYLGLIITSLGGLSYLIKTLQGKVQPNRVTWFMWGLAPLIAFFAQVKEGVGSQSLLTLTVALVPFIVFFASFLNKKSYWEVSKVDILFGALSLVGLIIWQITGVGNIAIIFSLIADFMASFPTLMKSFHFPETEHAFTYFTTIIGSLITLLTIDNWDFATYSFPLYLFVIAIVFTILIQFKIGKRLSKK
jgi:hypothetical protein